MHPISARIESIRDKIAATSIRKPEDILLVCVTKTISPEMILKALLHTPQITDIAENRVQDARRKYQFIKNALPPERKIRWHLIGHLQTNKVAHAIEIFDLIQSVDSAHLAVEINKRAQLADKIQDILIEVKVSDEASKTGCLPSEVPALAKQISTELKSLRLLGIMAMAPYFEEEANTRSLPYFEKAKKIYDEIYDLFVPNNPYTTKPVLSMGMSSDFEAAVKAGANMVRIGSAIFQESN